jgi:hypothetical protein
VQTYEALNMGPLLKHPKIIEYFRPAPTVTTIPDIGVHHVVEALAKCMSGNYKKQGARGRLEILVRAHYWHMPCL